jgi:4-hydroxy-3-methylbut-2-enyl diphosphate reductase
MPPALAPSPGLLVLAPLRLEAMALAPKGDLSYAVARTGMGPAKAASAAARLAAEAAAKGGPAGTPPRAVALAGLGGALDDALVPGDVIVAERVLDSTGREVARLPSASLLAGELARSGVRAKTGTVVTADHIVTGEERAQLAALGADVVDMESAAVAGAGWACPLAVVRAVSDSPGHELFSPAGARGALRALRALRACRAPLARWAQATGPREVLLAGPRGFCAGVIRAIETVERALGTYGPPVYVRRQIVHNSAVVQRLEALGAVFVHELSEVPEGARVVFSAHGVGTAVIEQAASASMATIDATCPLVAKVHSEGRRFAAAGRQVVLVGHAGHDEVEGTLGSVAGARLVTTGADVGALDLADDSPIAVITQTTLTADEVHDVVDALGRRFADLARPGSSDICYASQNRQEAVRQLAPQCELVVVVGSSNSSNSNRLVEVARRGGTSAHLVGSAADVELSWLAGVARVGISAGASAPEELVQQLVECLAGLGDLKVSERPTSTEHVNFPLPLEVR